MKKEGLVTRIIQSRSALAELWAGVPDQKLDLEMDHQSGWSIKALVAHLTFWERATLDCRSGRSSPASLKDVPGINSDLLVQARNRTANDVIRDFHESGKQIIDEINRLEDHELQQSSPWNDGKALWEHLADDTFVHYEEHEPKLRKWVETL